jgi:peptidoglycan/xylan/chitin deacetylase (PgdA/CDA1 family)
MESDNIKRNNGVILLYHRVYKKKRDPYQLCVDPRNFSEHLRHISLNYTPLSLIDLVKAISNDNVPEDAVTITFDDGYADNFALGLPLLREFQVPATIFIASGYINAPGFWWDALEHLVLEGKARIDTVSAKVDGFSYSWKISPIETEEILGSLWQLGNRSWFKRHNDQKMTSQSKETFYDLFFFLQSLNSQDRATVLASISEQLRKPYHFDVDRPLTESETAELAGERLIDIGAHTCTHSLLRSQTVLMQTHEIIESKSVLERLLGKEIRCFSYPFGGINDIGGVAPSIVRSAGYHCACTSVPGHVAYGSDHFMLPRITVRNWNVEILDKHIQRWLHG